MNEPDEDNLSRESPSSEPLPDVVKKRATRKGKKDVPLADMMPDILTFLHRVVKGETFMARGPTGKAFECVPTLHERTQAAYYVANKYWATLEAEEPAPVAEPPPDGETIRRAVIDDLIARRTSQAGTRSG